MNNALAAVESTTHLIMPFFQPPVAPLPASTTARGKTAIVTGASSGIGLAIAQQLLERDVITLVLAVRNVAKGEAVRRSLLAHGSPKAVVKVIQLDTEDYKSVQAFSKAFLAEHSELHLLLLNAGIGTLKYELAPTGHEKNVQVNYLSNVLLLLELYPLLNATAEKTGVPARVTWTGSRMHGATALAKKAPLKPGEAVIAHFDTQESFVPFARYADAKLLCVLFLYELSKHLTSEKIVVNSFCPGMVDTGMSNVLPFYLRLPVSAVKAIRARSPEKAAWLALNAVIVAGPETHGQLLGDKEITEPVAYVKSADGQKVQKLLWNETVDEMSKLTTVPAWFTKV